MLKIVKIYFVKNVKQNLKHKRNTQIMQDHVQIENLCLTCNKELKRSDSLLNHACLHYPNRNSFICPVCTTKCLTEKELHLHIVEEHITM